MKWIPETPVRTTIGARFAATDFKKSHKFDFSKGDFVGGGTVYVDGVEAFKQSVEKLVLTDREKFSYGLMNGIFKASKLDELRMKLVIWR
ncbi:DUF2634 domain-containing protein [Brevibacillus brevis]|uniref:DUF2634 domain-containing protein n=1 Tax=Brevibacillus brevis TaxID=1393 RepID=UPI000D0E4EED|nr:DUF2634 domain-containing protein [Brevibacillus brevis]PSJ70239.1 hypothetical protein C7J99_06700 [Brevibacillus brevis]RED30125.1 hypothetical protein DES34_105344 [Brevibacillus brevis]GEC88136.1 hypothetical protein BBR01nite_04670 [Brevibacillus brevis]VEF88672.1 Uncharacterised protein [Brevibacillus brevis]